MTFVDTEQEMLRQFMGQWVLDLDSGAILRLTQFAKRVHEGAESSQQFIGKTFDGRSMPATRFIKLGTFEQGIFNSLFKKD